MKTGLPPSPLRATLFYSACLFLLITVGGALQAFLKLPGVVLMQLMIFLGLAVMFAISADRRPVREVLRLRMLSATGVVKSVFVGLLGWGFAQVLSLVLIALVIRLGGKIPESYQMLTRSPFWIALLVGALVPAVCEEAAFRGYVLWNLGPLGRRTAAIATGVLFGAMHLSLIRVLPLALLGTIFALAVSRTGSILPGSIMHFTNNATALALTYAFRQAGRAGTESAPPTITALIVLAITALLLGAALLALLRTFSPSDLADTPAPAEPPTEGEESTSAYGPPEAPAISEPRILFHSLVALLPSVLLYAWAATQEVFKVFGRR